MDFEREDSEEFEFIDTLPNIENINADENCNYLEDSYVRT